MFRINLSNVRISNCEMGKRLALKLHLSKYMKELIPQEIIEQKIFLIRGKKVIFDKNLARMYNVSTKNLNKAVKRNIERFPEDFMLQLTIQEHESLRFQIGTLKRGQHTKYLPYAFTEQGVAMLSSVLRSEKAIQVNIAIMRVFIRLKQLISTHKEFQNKLNELERKIKNHDTDITNIFEALRKLMPPETKPTNKIGFISD